MDGPGLGEREAAPRALWHAGSPGPRQADGSGWCQRKSRETLTQVSGFPDERRHRFTTSVASQCQVTGHQNCRSQGGDTLGGEWPLLSPRWWRSTRTAHRLPPTAEAPPFPRPLRWPPHPAVGVSSLPRLHGTSTLFPAQPFPEPGRCPPLLLHLPGASAMRPARQLGAKTGSPG